MKRKQYKEIRVDYKYFLILFILVIIRCKTDVNKPSIDLPISPIPTEKTIALIMPYQNSGWSVAVTYNYKDFHQLTYIPFVSFVDWSPDKQYLIYLQSLQKEDQFNQEVWIMKYDGSNKKRRLLTS